jgi:DNA-directed RNA polymerase specialized sigma24 family protein
VVTHNPDVVFIGAMELHSKSTEDQQISSLVAQGAHREAARLLLDHYGEIVFALCAGQVEERTEAETLTLESFSRIFSRLPDHGAEDSISSWVLQVAGECCLERLHSVEPNDSTGDRQALINTVNMEAVVARDQQMGDSLRKRLEELAGSV